MRAAALLLLLLAGCDEQAAPAEARGPSRGIRGPADLPSPVAAPSPPSTSRSRRDRPPAASPSVERAEPAVAAPAPSPEGPTASDLSDALRRGFGTPTDCISAATRERLTSGDGVRSLTLQVQVVVTGSGRVTRASVSGSQLGEDDLECLRRRAEGVRIDARIPDAPRSITTSIEYEVRATRASPEGPDPIVGVPRGPGQVAPSSTLPGAQTETERPPGFIPPSSTLPALAE